MAAGDIDIGADAQPADGSIVIGTSPVVGADGDIIIGADAQPADGSIVIGTSSPIVGGPQLIQFEVPRLKKGTVVLALVVRNGAVQALPGWDKVIDGVGASGRFLDGWARMLDDEDMRDVDDELLMASFMSESAQELQGRLLVTENTAPAYMVEAIQHAAITADATPTAPAILSQQAVSRVVHVVSVGGAVDLDPPAGFDVEDTYTSDAVEERTIGIASKLGNASGTLAAVDWTASPAASGRIWTIVLRNNPPVIPGELEDVVPGHIGLI